jgi:hypothetical protein
MLPLTVALIVGWVALVGAFRTRFLPAPWWVDMLVFVAMQFGMPLLAGALVAGWRHGASNRLQTLGLACAAGAVSSWLFLLALHVTQYYHNLDGTPYTPPQYVFWWGLLGALCGALGSRLWLPLARLTRRGPRQPFHSR